jgi:hypothetical protein
MLYLQQHLVLIVPICSGADAFFYYNWNGRKYCKLWVQHLEQQLLVQGGTVNVTVTAVTSNTTLNLTN